MLDEEATEGEIGDIKVQVYKVKSRTSDRVQEFLRQRKKAAPIVNSLNYVNIVSQE